MMIQYHVILSYTGTIDNLRKARNLVQKDVATKKKAKEDCEVCNVHLLYNASITDRSHIW